MKTPIKVPFWTVLLAGVLLAITVAITIIVMIKNNDKNVIAGWGDSSGGRPSYTMEMIESGVLGDTVIFNTISDSTFGNEKNFVAARVSDGDHGKDNIWNLNEITVEDGAVYVVRLCVHNNSTQVSENTKVAFNIPTKSAKTIAIHGFIFSDNASPDKYWDGILFKSDSKFHLEYIYGSALLENTGVGKNGGRSLSDEIVTKAASNNGTLIGYTSLDGIIPGGYEFVSYITIKVTVVFD